MKLLLVIAAILISFNAFAGDYYPEYDPQAEQAARSPRWPLPNEVKHTDWTTPYDVILPPEVIYQEWLEQQKLMNRFWCPDMEMIPELQVQTAKEPVDEPQVDMMQMYWEDIWRARNPLQFEEEGRGTETIRHIEFKPEKPANKDGRLSIITIEF